MKKSLKRFLATLSCAAMLMTSVASAFTDLSYDHWAYNSVNKMQQQGVINGFEDGSFRPDEAVTREQFATILVKTLGLTKKTATVKFEDVENNRWSKNYIDIASEYLTGYMGNGKYYFRPADMAVREDIAVAIVKAKGLENQTPDYSVLNKFSDKDAIADNMQKYVAIAIKNGVMNGNANGTFNPNGALTRAEIAAVMTNVIEKVAISDIITEKEEEKKPVKVPVYEDDDEELPDFYYNKSAKTIDLGEEYSKYRVAFVNKEDDEFGKIDEMSWYRPITKEEGEWLSRWSEEEVLVDKNGIIDLANRTSWTRTKDYLFIKMAGYDKLGYKKFYVGEEPYMDNISGGSYSVNLGEDYYKYEVSFNHGGGPGKWYTPIYGETDTVQVNSKSDSDIVMKDRADWARSQEYIYIRQKAYPNNGYKKIYVGAEEPIYIEKDIKDAYDVKESKGYIELYPDGFEHFKIGLQYGQKKNGKYDGKIEYYDIEELEDEGVIYNNKLYLDDVKEIEGPGGMYLEGIVISVDPYADELEFAYEFKVKYEELPDFKLIDNQYIDFGKEYSKYEVAYGDNGDLSTGWYDLVTKVKDKSEEVKVDSSGELDLTERTEFLRYNYIHIREKANKDKGTVKVYIGIVKYEVEDNRTIEDFYEIKGNKITINDYRSRIGLHWYGETGGMTKYYELEELEDYGVADGNVIYIDDVEEIMEAPEDANELGGIRLFIDKGVTGTKLEGWIYEF